MCYSSHQDLRARGDVSAKWKERKEFGLLLIFAIHSGYALPLKRCWGSIIKPQSSEEPPV